MFYTLTIIYFSALFGKVQSQTVVTSHLTADVCLSEMLEIEKTTKKHKFKVTCLLEGL